MEAEAGALFQTLEGEARYLELINLLITLAPKFEENIDVIKPICAQLDTIPLHHSIKGLYIILEETVRQQDQADVSYIMTMYREIKNSILAILVMDPVYKGAMANLLDKYILSLAIVGHEKALSCHRPLSKVGRRKEPNMSSGYFIQSVIDPDFSMRNFLLYGPISMFYGYKEPALYEVYRICHFIQVASPSILTVGYDSYFRDNWMGFRHIYGVGCKNVVRIIQGLEKEKRSATRRFKKLYPNENLNIVRVLTRLT